jgi:hypothetical protein
MKASSSAAVGSAPGLGHDQQQRALLPAAVRHADHGGLLHGRVAHRDVLEVDRRDPLAAGLDDVLAAVGDLHEAVGVHRRPRRRSGTSRSAASTLTSGESARK